MTKEELVAMIEAQSVEINKVKDAAGGRKLQVLKILQTGDHTTVKAIAARIGISDRNVSSQMTYLRKDGYAIATDSLGRKFLESTGQVHESAGAKVITRKKAV